MAKPARTYECNVGFTSHPAHFQVIFVGVTIAKRWNGVLFGGVAVGEADCQTGERHNTGSLKCYEIRECKRIDIAM